MSTPCPARHHAPHAASENIKLAFDFSSYADTLQTIIFSRPDLARLKMIATPHVVGQITLTALLRPPRSLPRAGCFRRDWLIIYRAPFTLFTMRRSALSAAILSSFAISILGAASTDAADGRFR